MTLCKTLDVHELVSLKPRPHWLLKKLPMTPELPNTIRILTTTKGMPLTHYLVKKIGRCHTLQLVPCCHDIHVASLNIKAYLGQLSLVATIMQCKGLQDELLLDFEPWFLDFDAKCELLTPFLNAFRHGGALHQPHLRSYDALEGGVSTPEACLGQLCIATRRKSSYARPRLPVVPLSLEDSCLPWIAIYQIMWNTTHLS